MDEGKPFEPFVLFNPEGDGDISWPTFDTTDGRPMVVVFTDAAKAKQFMAAKGVTGYRVGKMSQPEFLRWLRHNLTNGVAALIAVDPEPAESMAVEILRLLAEYEG
jgi:hypothetical protein